MPSLVLIRHGQASFGGPTYDVLSETGHQQAVLVAHAVRERRLRVERIITGSLSRQRDTAAPIAADREIPIEVDERWNEYVTEDILTHHSSSLLREEQADQEAPKISSREFQVILENALGAWIAAGSTGSADEPWPTFSERVQAALTDALVGLSSGAAAVVVTSGGPIGAICAELLQLGGSSLITFNRVVINGAISMVTAGRGGRTLVSFNEHGHLQGAGGDLLTYR